MIDIDYNERVYALIGCAYKVHSKLGPGLLESIYERALVYELQKAGFDAKPQQSIKFMYAPDLDLGDGLKVDILVDDTYIIELKSVESLLPVHFKQLLSYLKLSGKKQGWLINFNVSSLKDNIHSVINPNYKSLQ